jgi:hypothetical protein
MSYSATLAWIAAHPPRDLIQSGTAGTDGPAGSTAGYGYSDRPTTSWASADLDVGVAPDGDGSVIRADAVVVWLDPKPIRDTTTGQRLHVTVTGGCPASDRGVVGVRNDDQRLHDRLLPEGQPSGALVCRYDGANGKPFALRKTTRLDAGSATTVADAVRRLPLSHADGGVHGCPSDDGAAAIVVLAFPGSGDVDVRVKMNGCSVVSNGYIVTASRDVPDVLEQYG